MADESKKFEELLSERASIGTLIHKFMCEPNPDIFRKQFVDLISVSVCEDDDKTFGDYFFDISFLIDTEDESLEGYGFLINSKRSQLRHRDIAFDKAFLKYLAAASRRWDVKTSLLPEIYCEMIMDYLSDEEEMLLLIAFGIRNIVHLLPDNQKQKLEWLLKARILPQVPGFAAEFGIDVVEESEKLKPFFEAKACSVRAFCAIVKILCLDFDSRCVPMLQLILGKYHDGKTDRKSNLCYWMRAIQAILIVLEHQMDEEEEEPDEVTLLDRNYTLLEVHLTARSALLEANASIFDLSPEERFLAVPGWAFAIDNLRRSLHLRDDDVVYSAIFACASEIYRLAYLAMGWSDESMDIVHYTYALIYDICVHVPGALEYFLVEEDMLNRMLKMLHSETPNGLREIMPMLSMILHTDQNRSATEMMFKMSEVIAKDLVVDFSRTPSIEHTIRTCTFLGAVAWNSNELFDEILRKTLEEDLDCFSEAELVVDDMGQDEAFEVLEAFANISGRPIGRSICQQILPVKEVWDLLDFVDEDSDDAYIQVISVLQYIANMCSHPIARKDIICCRAARFIHTTFVSCATYHEKPERSNILAWLYVCVARFAYQFSGGRQELYEHNVFEATHFVKCLEFTQPNRDLVELAFGAMFNASKDSAETKTELSRYGTAKVMLEMFKTWKHDKSIAQRACRLLYNLCRTKPNRKFFVRLDAANIVRSCAATNDFKEATLRVLKL